MAGTPETQYTCPFCNHEKSCGVKMDHALNTGSISRTVCLKEFQTPTLYLPELLDVSRDTPARQPISSNVKKLLLRCPQPMYQSRDIPGLGVQAQGCDSPPSVCTEWVGMTCVALAWP